MKTLILGSNGYIGRALMDCLPGEVYGVDNNYREGNVREVGSKSLIPFKPHKNTEYLDICHYDSLKEKILDVVPDVIIHLAEQSSAPFCFPLDVEVLTNTGFKNVLNLEKEDKIATANLSDKILEYQKPIKINIFDYEGEMLKYKRNGLELLCTPNHKFIHHQKNKSTNKWNYIETIAKNRKRIDAPKTFNTKNNVELSINDNWFSLAGWIVSEGCYNESRGWKNISIYQSENNGEKCRKIEKILKNLNINYYKYSYNYSKASNKRGWFGKINTYRIKTSDRDRVEKYIPNKYNIPNFVKNGSLRQKKLFINAFIDGDGHRKKDGRVALYFGKKEKDLADEFQFFLTENGFSTSLLYDNDGYGKYVVYILKSKHLRLNKIGTENYKGKVWCPTTENGNWICRKDGNVFLSGNSMIDAKHATETQVNNIVGTLNLLFAVKQINPDIHIIKLGTAGEYPDWLYDGIEIPEGARIKVKYQGKDWEIPTPRYAGSWYHFSKLHDSYNIDYACRIWGLKVTDINQGIVYGHRKGTRFDYDEYFGTVVNRFAVQKVLGMPLTIYGDGGQTRGFIHIDNVMQAIELISKNPPKGFRIIHQLTEELSIKEIAKMFKCKTQEIRNPRAEMEKNKFKFEKKQLIDFGLKPIKMKDEINKLVNIIKKHKNKINKEVIMPLTNWV